MKEFIKSLGPMLLGLLAHAIAPVVVLLAKGAVKLVLKSVTDVDDRGLRQFAEEILKELPEVPLDPPAQ